MFHVHWRHYEEAYVEGARLIKVRSSRSEFKDHFFEKVTQDLWDDEFHFNRAGKLIRSIDYANEEELVYAYRPDGVLVQVMCYHIGSHELVGYVLFRYDSQGRVTEEVFHEYEGEEEDFTVSVTRHYYKEGIYECHKPNGYHQVSIERFFYNEQQQLVLSHDLTKHTKTLREELEHMTEYRYDADGQLAERIFKDPKGHVKERITGRVYQQGQLQRYERHHNNTVTRVEHTLVFNERGHVVHEKHYENGYFKFVEEKRIGYYE